MDVTRERGHGVDLRPTMDKIRSCVEDVVRPLTECPPHHTHVYNALCPILRELPEYKLLQQEVRRLTAQLERQNTELDRLKRGLDELSSEGEGVVLEVRDREMRQDASACCLRTPHPQHWDGVDAVSQCSSDSEAAPTFPSGCTIKRIPGLSSEIETSWGHPEREANQDEGEASDSEEEVEDKEAADSEEVEDKEASDSEEEEGDDEDEEVEEMVIHGTSYYCSPTTIYECTSSGDVGEEVGIFRNKRAVFHATDSSDPDVDFM